MATKVTDTEIRNLKAREKLYRVALGEGFCIQVMPDGSKWWRLRYRFAGVEKMLALGVYAPDTFKHVPLKIAAQKAADARALLARGTDPSEAKRESKLALRFTVARKFGAAGNSYSGSTAWHNSARSRLALVHTDGAIELRQEKLNLGKPAAPAVLAWSESGEEAATVLSATLLSALERLGVAGDSLGVGFTKAGEDIIATFKAVATSAVATGAQIEAGFKAALARVSTSQEAQALGAALEEAGKRGVVGFDAAERSAAALRARLREIEEAANPLADAFERLGITSQRELKNTADTAREAFDVIVSGAQRGQAATEDVRRAFVAYAKAQLDAAANSTAWERAQVEGMIRVRAQALGVTDALGELGLAGERAGAQVAGGANQATDALRGTEAAAEGAASAAGQLAASGTQVAISLGDISSQAQAASFNLDGVSDRFKQLLTDQQLYKGGGTQLFQDLNRQTRELEEQLRLIEAQAAAYDPLTAKVQGLRAQYELLGDEQLQRLAQAQLQLEEQQRKEQEALQLKIKADRESRMFRPGGNKDGDTSGRRVAAPVSETGVSVTVNTFGDLSPAVRRDMAKQLARDINNELKAIGAMSR